MKTAPGGRKRHVAFALRGRAIETDLAAPKGAVSLDALLPELRRLDDLIIDAVTEAMEADGRRVSCAKGCSACCRVQPVPVTPPEAHALAKLVAALPELERVRVRAAFDKAVARLKGADLYEGYAQRDPNLTKEEALAAVRRYMALAFTCPFLVDDACSIHQVRPFVCRQYLVSSPPALCDAPLDEPVKPLPMPAGFAKAMLEASEALYGTPQYSMPLVMALDYAERHAEELARTFDGAEALERVLGELGA